jgi:hypothetical protein
MGEGIATPFLTSTIDIYECMSAQIHIPSALAPKKELSIYPTGGRVGPQNDLDAVK